MAKEYVKLWDSYAAYFEPLSEAEVGRLVLAMLKYKSTGTAPELKGNERFVWPAVQRDIDAAIEAQNDLSSTRSSAGKQGGRPKSKCFSEKANESKCFLEKAKKAMDKDKDKVKDKVKDSIAAEAATGARAREEALSDCIRCYEGNIGPTPRYVADDMLVRLESVSPDLICAAIEEAAQNGARSWKYVKAILARCEQTGIRDADTFRADRKSRAESGKIASAGGKETESRREELRQIVSGSKS